LDYVLESCKSSGATVLGSWTEEDENGLVSFATVSTTGNVTHTFVERSNFHGVFLPGFKKSILQQPKSSPPLKFLEFIDHCVATRFEDTIESTQEFYENSLSFHRFWSVDDRAAETTMSRNVVSIETADSSLKFLVVANENESIKMTILEPGPVKAGKKKSQVQEFNEYNAGPGIQHIALHTRDIINCVRTLRDRGLEFLKVPDNYYETLKEKLKESRVIIEEDLEELKEQQILLDYDENGYLLQIFTKPVQDRPTLFLEIIQRNNHNGFGAGNFTALFKAVEREQLLRGNLN
jgi:4-hydroxyphenylpyruvate dioxygenase